MHVCDAGMQNNLEIYIRVINVFLALKLTIFAFSLHAMHCD